MFPTHEPDHNVLDRPLTAENMNTDGALRLLAAIFESLRNDYIHGKLTLIRHYGRDMTEKEYNELPCRREGRVSNLIRLYFSAKRAVMKDYYGVGDAVLPEDIFSAWDAEVYKHLGEVHKFDEWKASSTK